jgi:diguanylate cyclase (GGDEF)-like protein
MRLRRQLFDSRLARRVFGLFILASLVPLFVLAVWLSQRVSGALEAEASTKLASATRAYGRLTLEKMLSVAALMPEPTVLASAGGTGISVAGIAAAVVVEDSITRPLLGAWPDAPTTIVADDGMPTVTVARGPDEEWDVLLAHRSGAAMVLVRLERGQLWRHEELLAADMDVCVVGGTGMPLHCSAPLPAEALARLNQARLAHSSGEIHWSHDGEEWITAYWELFLPSRLMAEPWTIAVSQPRAVALASLATFNRIVAQAAILTLALIVILASVQIRRTLTPLRALLAATERIGAQDFTTRVEIDDPGEFGAVGSALNSMTDELRHQFSSLRALADIDRLILQTAAVETVLETLLLRLRALVPHGDHLVLIIDANDPEHGRVYRAGADTRIVLDRVRIVSELVEWLATMAAGHATNAATLATKIAQLAAWPPSTDVRIAPLLVDGRVAGALLAAGTDGAPFGQREVTSICELAVRVSVALAAGKREAELVRRAHFDPLTGLPNRELLADRLGQAVAQVHRSERRLAVLFLDLDGFKEINDSLGHRNGDELLKETAMRLSAVLRDTDTVARLGGDEYAFVLPQIDGPLEAETIAAKIIEAISRPFLVDDREVFVSASIGIALCPDDGDTAEELLRRADMAMYSAKDSGKACYRFFAGEMDEQIQERRLLQHDLRRALNAGELFLAYQPQREFATRRVVSAEALLRWRHPRRGLVSPSLFIPILEEVGLIREVGAWVLRSALTDLARWRSQGLALEHVAVNVSARQLQDPRFADDVIDAIRAHGLEGRDLEVEITEASVVADFRGTNETLSRLVKHGVRIALDDFGTGYSSLAYLNELVFDTLKIDRGFVINLPAEKSVAIVKAIIAVAGTLGKKVVAEGIETELQYRKLASLGCDLGQGYLLSRPLEAEAFAAWVQALLAEHANDSTSRIWRPGLRGLG